MAINSHENRSREIHNAPRERDVPDRRAIRSRSPRPSTSGRKTPPSMRRNEEERGRSRQQKSHDTRKRPLDNNASDDSQGSGKNSQDTNNDDMSAVMGFSSFGTTKQKKVGPDVSSASISRPSKFRQYMNRDKGFNRDLSPP